MTNPNFKKRILIVGIPDMAYIGVDTLYSAGVNIVGVMGPQKTHNTYNDFRAFVQERNLKLIDWDSLTSPDLHKTIKDLDIDLGVVFSFNNKFPKEFLELAKDGFLNLHPSLLPYYRGGNPYSRVIMNGENETGVTVHFMSENFDEGDIVAQVKCPIEDRETMGSLFQKTNYLGVRVMLTALTAYEKEGKLPRVAQPQGEFPTAKNLSPSEYIIDFNKTAIEIERKIRALNPYITCYTYYKGQTVKLYKAKVADIEIPENASNGEIVKIENNKIYIKTSQGALSPEVLQFGGYFTGDIDDFISLTKPSVGDTFGNG